MQSEKTSGDTTAGKLEWSRRQLLDLTARNKLLNFPAGAPGFKDRDNRVYKHLPVRVNLDAVWQRLLNDKSSRIFSCQEGEQNTRTRELIDGGALAATFDEESLDKRLIKLFRERENLEQLTGDSAFFLALGFLEWRDAPESKSNFAPLILLHVEIVRSKTTGGGFRTYSIQMDADEHWGNPCLKEKLKLEHYLDLPPVETINSPEEYLKTVEAAVAKKQQWRVHRTASLGFFNFTRYRLWLDLDPSVWPLGASPAEHALIKDLIEQRSNNDQSLPDDREIADHQVEKDLPIVLDADSTQYAAILAAVRGQSIVVIGPPGSGKSQTITNLIAVMIAEGKRVLFVAQKLAALEVVQRRLAEVGLAAFCLPLHSHRSKPADVHQQLRLATAASEAKSGPPGMDGVSHLAKSLNAVAQTLGTQPPGLSSSVAELLQRGCVVRAKAREMWGNRWDEGLLDLEIPDGDLNGPWHDEGKNCLQEWARFRTEAQEDWKEWNCASLTALDATRLEEKLRKLEAAVKSCHDGVQSLPPALGELGVETLSVALCNVLQTTLPDPLIPSLLAYAWRCGEKDVRQLYDLERLLDDFHHQRDRAMSKLRDGSSPADLAKAVMGAVATVAEWVRPSTPLHAAEGLLVELAAAIGKIDNLLADSIRFSDGVRWLAGGIEATGLTWKSVDDLAALRIDPAVEDHPVLHHALARALADGRISQQDLRELLQKIERARETQKSAEAKLPGIKFIAPEDRQRWIDATDKLVAAGVGNLTVRTSADLLLAGQRLYSSTEELIATYGQTGSAVSRLLPELTTAACARLAERAKVWTADLLCPADPIPNELLNVLTRALASQKISFPTLHSWAEVLETARSLEKQIQTVLPALGPGSGLVEIPQTFTSTVIAYCAGGGSNATPAELVHLRKTVDQVNHFIAQSLPFFSSVARAFGQTAPVTLADIKCLAELSTLLTKMPPLPINGMLNRASSHSDVSRLQQAMAAAKAMDAKREVLAARHVSAALPPRDNASSLRRRLEARQGKFFKWFSKDYRAARRTAAEMFIPPLPDDLSLISHLAEVETHLHGAAMLAADGELAQLTEGQFKGPDTNWTDVAPVLVWAEEFFNLLPNTQLDLARLASLKTKSATKLEAPARLFDQLNNALTNLTKKFGWAFTGTQATALLAMQQDQCRLDELCQILSFVGVQLGHIVDGLNRFPCPAGVTLERISEAVKRKTKLSEAMESLDALRTIIATPLLQTDPAHIRLVANWVERCLKNQFSISELTWIAQDRRRAVEEILLAGRWATEWTSALTRLCDVMPDGRWRDDAPLASKSADVARLLNELNDLMADLPDLKTPDLTFKSLGELLLQLQSCDRDREQSVHWDKLLEQSAFDSDPGLLRQTAAWTRLASAGIGRDLLVWCLERETDARLHWLKAMKDLAIELRQSVDRVGNAGFIKFEELRPTCELDELRETFSTRLTSIRAGVEFLMGAARDGSFTIEELSRAGAALSRSCTLTEQLASWEKVLAVPVTSLNAAQVADHRRWAMVAISWGNQLGEWVLQGEAPKQYEKIGAARDALKSALLIRQVLLSWMQDLGEAQENGPAGIADGGMTVETFHTRIARLQAALPRLLPWADCLRHLARAHELGLSALMNVATAAFPRPSQEELLIALDAAIAVHQATFAWNSERRLNTFRGHAHDRLRREFAEADASLLRRNRNKLSERLRAQRKALTFGTHRAATPQMHNLLNHEAQKLRKHISVRKLVERAGSALQEICPCWLMTPMAVAQFLPPGKIDFDIVIMDEASQLAPENAWGAIKRGKQLIIVGDPKQMPPTDFFSTSVDDDEDEPTDDEPSGEKSDSILDTASLSLPHSWLQWHYRSRHQSLIAAANHFSYGDKLILFPSAHDRDPEMGIVHRFIENAVTTPRRVENTEEAKAIVDRLIEIAKKEETKPPERRLSVAVVAMNMPQQECIQNLLDEQVKADAQIERAIECLKDIPNEPLIIRNLENIQGDERDVVLISYTYGPNTPGGTPAQRFGPLNSDGGERRFNVLITRSKCRMEVFSSLRSDQILVTGKKAGVQHFHYFLKFAETGTLTEAGGVTKRTTDSPFEDYVLAVLKEEGYQVEPQVGVAGYFIDLAVRDPRDPDRFILGIECDGATYHSSKAARDRDRLREQVLRDRGWRLHRIWSTDWFREYDATKEALIVTVARICEGML